MQLVVKKRGLGATGRSDAPQIMVEREFSPCSCINYTLRHAALPANISMSRYGERRNTRRENGYKRAMTAFLTT